MNDVIRVDELLRDVPLRGAVRLPGGRVGLVFEGGSVATARDVTVVEGWYAEQIREAVARTNAEARVSLSALGNLHGPSTADRLQRRREEVRVDATGSRRTIDLTGVEDLTFVGDEYESAASQSDRSKREARLHRIEAETPEV